jgi:hypothetical protein
MGVITRFCKGSVRELVVRHLQLLQSQYIDGLVIAKGFLYL